jgi:hypothetical protein
MINKDKLLILFSVTLILLSTIIIWYSNINKKSISNCFTTTLSDEDANNIVSEYSDKKRYYYETEQIIKTKSLIPLIYNTRVLKTKPKQLLQKNKYSE